MEVGVAGGRFSQHFLSVNDQDIFWHMVEPFPNNELKTRFHISNGTANFEHGLWDKKQIGRRAFKIFSRHLSMDDKLLQDIPDQGFDFIYLDGAHDYKNVRLELPAYYKKIRPGGVLAGHDYCTYGEPTLQCLGCSVVPRCGKYTEYGVARGKPDGAVSNQAGVVSAVQEWLVEEQSELRVYYTAEDFTREGLGSDGFDYDLIITATRNPSWYVVKPK